MDLKDGCIDGCEVETIYPVNSVTAKTAHYNLFVSSTSVGKGWQLQVLFLEEMWNRAATGACCCRRGCWGWSTAGHLCLHLSSLLTRSPSLSKADTQICLQVKSPSCAFSMHCHVWLGSAAWARLDCGIPIPGQYRDHQQAIVPFGKHHMETCSLNWKSPLPFQCSLTGWDVRKLGWLLPLLSLPNLRKWPW